MSKKVAIVTGAASGIGLASAQALASIGVQVVMADINAEAVEREAAKIDGLSFRADLSTQEGCRGLVDFVLEQCGTVSILVNNAGIQHVSPLESFPEDKWNLIISLMLTAPFLLTKYVWPEMQKNKWGRVININSVHGLRASPFKAAYVAAKHGMTGLTKTAALEGGEYGITVNSICPAYVRTPLVDGQLADQAKTHNISEKEVIDQIMLKKAAVKRLIEPDEIGTLVNYLCSDAAACMSGSSLTIDCAWTAC